MPDAYACRWSTTAVFHQAANDNRQLIAHAGFEREARRSDRAESAMVNADGSQGRGLGRILLGRLAEMADHAGVQTFVGEVLADNHGELIPGRGPQAFELFVETRRFFDEQLKKGVHRLL